MDFKVAIFMLTFFAALVTGNESTTPQSPTFHVPITGEDLIRRIISRTLVHPCMMLLEVGNCKGEIPRYYYNMKTRKCQPFNFSGCGGNGNQFEDIRACRAVCESKDSIFQQRHPKKENTNTTIAPESETTRPEPDLPETQTFTRGSSKSGAETTHKEIKQDDLEKDSEEDDPDDQEEASTPSD